MQFIIRFLIKVATVITLSYLLPKIGVIVRVDGPLDAVKVALVLTLLNSFVRPLLEFFAFPITCLTLGLFSLAISAAMVVSADHLLNGFSVGGWLDAAVFSIAFSFISSLVERFIVDDSGN
jgi:putative membrane protein